MSATDTAPTSRPPSSWSAFELSHVSHVLTDLGLDPERVATPGGAIEAGAHSAYLCALPADVRSKADVATELVEPALAALDEKGALLLFLYGRRADRELAALRNGLWPGFHVVALYSLASRATRRRDLHGEQEIAGGPTKPSRAHTGVLVVARRAAAAMSPDTTVEKFDSAASGWNGRPGTAGYRHFRWMRRFVADLAKGRAGARVLDFGSGAGWVGIEAAKRVGAPELCAFDPSPQMVDFARRNAASEGIGSFRGLPGFGEQPPFPEPDQQPFELVVSSGVISFSPDRERWLDGLAATVAPGGTLVIGDIHRDSRGFRRRRAERPLLPVREMNASVRADVRALLEERGFVHEASGGYQLTRPVPELMHLSETRLKGLLSLPLLWANQIAASLDRSLGGRFDDAFDSWVMRLRRGKK